MRRAARRDSTEASIVRALQRAGADVIRLDKFDLLVLHRGTLHMLDAKSAGGKITVSQQVLVDRGWPLQFPQTPEEALRAIGAIRWQAGRQAERAIAARRSV